jgi:hypothetical protein
VRQHLREQNHGQAAIYEALYRANAGHTLTEKMKMTKKFALLLMFILLSLPHFASGQTKDEDYQKKLDKAKTPVVMNGVGLFIADIIHITSENDKMVGFKGADLYSATHNNHSIVYVIIGNESKSTLHVNPLYFKATTKKKQTVSLSKWTFRTRKYINDVNLEPGTTTSGFVVFERSKGDDLDSIIFDDGIGHKVERKYTDAILVGFDMELKKKGIK